MTNQENPLTATDPGSIYAHGWTGEMANLTRVRRITNVLVWIRIFNLLAFVVLAYEACGPQSISSLWSVLSIVTFFAFSVAIYIAENQVKKCESLVRYFEEGQTRLAGRPVQGAPTGLRFADPTHPYAADLDLFGPASLFALICAARTGAGQTTLAQWLKNSGSVDEIAQRQQAVRELRERLTLRRDLWLAGGVFHENVREDALEAWLAAPVMQVSGSKRIITGIIGVLGIPILWALFTPDLWIPALIIVLLQRLYARTHRNFTHAVEAGIFRRAYELHVVAQLAERLQGEHFDSPYLTQLCNLLTAEVRGASHAIKRLVRLVDWLESRRNPVFAIFAAVFLLPEQLSFAIEAWRARHGSAAVQWLTAIGEIEAMLSIATFSFEHPAFQFPDIRPLSVPPQISATALGHPLIPEHVRITNDVRLDPECRLFIVTGSNMSGKSTWLRTVGVNTILALMGSPVCAKAMTLSPLQVGASLRAQDSLEEGVSRFFAEIKRLSSILEKAKQTPPILFLLDEILNGTNSHDRREGAFAIIRILLERKAIGIVTTHDLALSELANSQEFPAQNVHFQDSLEENRLIFDYRMRPGVVSRRNALDLMRLVGIDVPT
jgi:hypothetical protein